MSTLFEDLFERARQERDRKAQATSVVARDDLAPELTPFGELRWYLHSRLDEPVAQALYFMELTIPVGSRSGKLRHQGGVINLGVARSGHTDLNGMTHEWAARDVIAIPTIPQGVVFQHVNTGDEPVRMIVSFPNDSALGPELGVELDILEPVPEYVARNG